MKGISFKRLSLLLTKVMLVFCISTEGIPLALAEERVDNLSQEELSDGAVSEKEEQFVEDSKSEKAESYSQQEETKEVDEQANSQQSVEEEAAKLADKVVDEHTQPDNEEEKSKVDSFSDTSEEKIEKNESVSYVETKRQKVIERQSENVQKNTGTSNKKETEERVSRIKKNSSIQSKYECLDESSSTVRQSEDEMKEVLITSTEQQVYVDSHLTDFELPILSKLKDKKSAAILIEALKQIDKPFGEKEDEFTNCSLVTILLANVFGVTLSDYTELESFGEQVESIEEAVPGDLFFWSDDKDDYVGLYLGQNKVLLITEALKNKLIDGEETATVSILEVIDKKTEATFLTDDNQVVLPKKIIHYFNQVKLSEKGNELVGNYPATYIFEENETTERFIQKIAEDARELGRKHNVFSSVMIAQAILESASGSSGLSVAPYYNLFGIKGGASSHSVPMITSEDDGNGNLYQITSLFRVYNSYKESLEDYVSLLRHGISGNELFYKQTWRTEAKNYLNATEALTGRYATDIDYHKKLNSLISTYHLTQYDRPKEVTGIVLQSKEEIPLSYQKLMGFPNYNGVDYNHSGSYPVGQCTWYAYNRVSQLGGKVDDYMGNGGEWGTKGRQLGYTVTDIPKAGYLVSFHPGVAGSSSIYGHVAFVEAVGREGILISEGNVLGGKTISYRVIPNEIARSSMVDYIKPK